MEEITKRLYGQDVLTLLPNGSIRLSTSLRDRVAPDGYVKVMYLDRHKCLVLVPGEYHRSHRVMGANPQIRMKTALARFGFKDWPDKPRRITPRKVKNERAEFEI